MLRGKQILIAEDSREDAIMLQQALIEAGIHNPVFVTRNGAEALAYLKGEGVFADRECYPLPAVLLLDRYMPLADGIEVLNWVKQQPGFENLLVVVMSKVNDVGFVREIYEKGAGSYLLKPVTAIDLMNLAHVFKKYWE